LVSTAAKIVGVLFVIVTILGFILGIVPQFYLGFAVALLSFVIMHYTGWNLGNAVLAVVFLTIILPVPALLLYYYYFDISQISSGTQAFEVYFIENMLAPILAGVLGGILGQVFVAAITDNS
jgi:hypothetical protein